MILQNKRKNILKIYEYYKPEIEKGIGEGRISVKADKEQVIKEMWEKTTSGGQTTAASSPLEMFSRLGGNKVFLSATLMPFESGIKILTGKGVERVGLQTNIEIVKVKVIKYNCTLLIYL